jgi:hypothetical protein
LASTSSASYVFVVIGITVMVSQLYAELGLQQLKPLVQRLMRPPSARR